MKDLNEELKKVAPIDLPDIPVVNNVPEGWPPLINLEGDTWYERAMNYEKWSGHRVLPLNLLYDENWNIKPAEEVEVPESNFVEPELTEEFIQEGGAIGWVEREEDGSSK